MLALLLFPMAEKAMHEIGHLDEPHCDITETHFCPVEHQCTICDYLFSTSAAITPCQHVQGLPFFEITGTGAVTITCNIFTSLKYCLPLRGPPMA